MNTIKGRYKREPFFRFLFTLEIIVVIIAIGLSFLMGLAISQKVKYESEYEDKSSFVENSGMDLIVAGPSFEQVKDFENKTFINEIIVFSKISLKIKINDYNDYNDFIILNSVESLKYTEFTEERIILKDESIEGIYADYRFCEIHNISLGDEIEIIVNGKVEKFKISRIYRTNYLYPEGVLVITKDLIEVNLKSCNVYLVANNKAEAISYLQQYKPLGTLLDKTDEQSNEEYEKYLDEFYGKNYYETYVTDLSDMKIDINDQYLEKINSVNKTFYIYTIITSFVCLFVSLVCFFINAKNNKDRIYRYISEHGCNKVILLYTIFNISFIFYFIIGVLCTMYYSLNRISTYYTYASIITKSYFSLLLPSVFILLGYIVTLIKIKKA